MADVHGSPGSAPQMPAAQGAGPAPVPYAGADQDTGSYAPAGVSFGTPGADVMGGVTGNAVQESGYAHDVNAGLVTPYYAGDISPVGVHGDADAGGRDDVSATVAGAVAAAEARYLEHEGDASRPGPSHLGDLMDLPDYGTAGVVAGSFYDPPRDYGGEDGR